MSRDLNDLAPELKEVAIEFREQCAECGIDVLIYQTYRGEKEQNEAYSKGKSRLKYPNSKHNVMVDGKPAARAFDAVPTKGNTLLWNDAAKYAKMGEIAEGLGLEWGGTWKSFIDKPHFQLPD